MTLTVVPPDSCRSDDISVDDSVDKPVQRAFDSGVVTKKGADSADCLAGSHASGLLIRAIDEADAGLMPALATETPIFSPQSNGRENPFSPIFVPKSR